MLVKMSANRTAMCRIFCLFMIKLNVMKISNHHMCTYISILAHIHILFPTYYIFTQSQFKSYDVTMGLLPDTQNRGMRMRRECWDRFPRHWLQRKPPVSDPGMHHGTCVKPVPSCMSRSLTCGGGENVRGIFGACASHHFAHLERGPWPAKTDTCIFYPHSLYRGHVRWK